MRFKYSLACVALSVLSILAVPSGAQGATALPAGFQEELLAGYPYPTALNFTADGKILLTTQTGQLRIFENGHMLPGPALDISGRICTDGERGLLGVAGDPADEHAVYLYYTSKGADDLRRGPRRSVQHPGQPGLPLHARPTTTWSTRPANRC